MAKYIDVPSLGMFTYALDECEDYLVLDAYLHIKNSGKANKLKYIKVFEFYHLGEGGTLNDNILMQLNASLRALGRPALVFVNGHTTNFAALRGQDKAARRQQILDHLGSLPPSQRVELIARKAAEASRLPERSGELPSRAPSDAGGLSRAETERRRQALANAQKADAARVTVTGFAQPQAPAPSPPAVTEPEREFVPESTVQDNVVELITEMNDLKAEVAALKAILQSIFRNV